MSLTSTLSEDQSELVIKIPKKFDYDCRQDFRKAYIDLEQSPKIYIIDLEQTTYIDSSALGMLLILKEHAKLHEGQITLKSPGKNVTELLKLSNFDKIFDLQ